VIRWLGHKLLRSPKAYELVQKLYGAEEGTRRVAELCADLTGDWVLDLAGGTGRLAHLWPEFGHYVCVDLDQAHLAMVHERRSDGHPVLGDALALPFADGVFDVVISVSLTHHLTLEQLDQAIAEAARVLASEGTLVLVDAIRVPGRLRSTISWWLDRGEHPHSARELEDVISGHLHIDHFDQFDLVHRYVRCTARHQRGSTGDGR
jgi:ubiquinone/menaquinone biosynthesis C-methylase UbiE